MENTNPKIKDSNKTNKIKKKFLYRSPNKVDLIFFDGVPTLFPMITPNLNLTLEERLEAFEDMLIKSISSLQLYDVAN